MLSLLSIFPKEAMHMSGKVLMNTTKHLIATGDEVLRGWLVGRRGIQRGIAFVLSVDILLAIDVVPAVGEVNAQAAYNWTGKADTNV